MRTAHIWNQYYLFGQKVAIIFLLLVAISHKTTAQRYINLPNYEDKKVRWGFQLGFQQSTLRLKNTTSALNVNSITSPWQPAFSAHFILQLALEDELWAFRLTPGVALYNRVIEKRDANKELIGDPFTNQASTIEFPLMLKYRSLRRRNFRMYMVGGVVPSIITGGGESSFLASSNFEITYGLGFDFYWQFFKFAPEIRFSHGLPNFYVPNPELSEVSRMTTHRVGLYLNFE